MRMDNASFRVVIPARYASTRFPGKALALLAGRPLVQHVYERAVASAAEEVIVATDDRRIADAAEAFGAMVIMTRDDHASGTDRIAEVAKALAHPARIRIARLFGVCRPRTVHEIVEECELAQSTISEHLRVLREAGVVFARPDGPRMWYCLRRSVLRDFARETEHLATDQAVAVR